MVPIRRHQRGGSLLGGSDRPGRPDPGGGRPVDFERADTDAAPAVRLAGSRLPRHHFGHQHGQPELHGGARLRPGDRPRHTRGEPARARSGGHFGSPHAWPCQPARRHDQRGLQPDNHRSRRHGREDFDRYEYPERDRRAYGAGQRQRQPDDQRHSNGGGDRDLHGHGYRHAGGHGDHQLQYYGQWRSDGGCPRHRDAQRGHGRQRGAERAGRRRWGPGQSDLHLVGHQHTQRGRCPQFLGQWR